MVWFDHLNAIQINKDNIEQIAEKLNAEVVTIANVNYEDLPIINDKYIRLGTGRGDMILECGDWVSYDRHKRLRLMRLHDLDISKVRKVTDADDDVQPKFPAYKKN